MKILRKVIIPPILKLSSRNSVTELLQTSFRNKFSIGLVIRRHRRRRSLQSLAFDDSVGAAEVPTLIVA